MQRQLSSDEHDEQRDDCRSPRERASLGGRSTEHEREDGDDDQRNGREQRDGIDSRDGASAIRLRQKNRRRRAADEHLFIGRAQSTNRHVDLLALVIREWALRLLEQRGDGRRP